MYGVEHDKYHDIYNLVKWFRIKDYSDEMIDDCISYIFERDVNWRGICRVYAEKGNIHDFRGKKLNTYYLVKEFKEKGYPEEALDICFKHIYNGMKTLKNVQKLLQSLMIFLKPKFLKLTFRNIRFCIWTSSSMKANMKLSRKLCLK